MNLILQLGALCVAVVAVGALARAAWRINKRIVAIANAVQQLLPNGGTSLADKVTRIDDALADHITNHPGKAVNR